MSANIPMYPVNLNAANQCYVILHSRNGDKRSHMSILVDLGGNSTNQEMIGELIHLCADQKDGQRPHTVYFHNQMWKAARDEITVIYVGNLLNSQYLTQEKVMPAYMTAQYLQPDIHAHTSNVATPIPIRRSSLLMLASQVYANMAQVYKEIWSSSMNCQQYARQLVIDGLGLDWPPNVPVCGDCLLLCVDVGIALSSSSNNIKHS